MRRHAHDNQGAMLERVGIPPREIMAIETAAESGRAAYLALCFATAVAIVCLAFLLQALHGQISLDLKAARIAGRPVIHYGHSWWSSFLIWPTVICGVVYAVHVALRAFPRLEECITAAGLQMQTSQATGKTGGLVEWLLRRNVACALGKPTPSSTFLQRGNDCTRRVYLVMFVLFAIPTVWCLDNDRRSFDFVTPDGVEYAAWLDGEPRRLAWRDLEGLTVECGSAGHGNFRLSFALVMPAKNGEHRISFSETFQPPRKFVRNGELEMSPASRDWMRKSMERFSVLSDWQARVAREGVLVERNDGAHCREAIAEGLGRLPEYYGPLAMMLGVAR